MSEENLENARQALDAFNRRDRAAWLALRDPDCETGTAYDAMVVADDAEWVVREAFEGQTVWVGREEFVEFMRTWTEEFDDWSFQVERLIDASDGRVVALTRQSGIGKESGVPVELNLGLVYELRDGRIARITNYLTHAEALEAAGLRE